jgi:hypothetical protein
MRRVGNITFYCVKQVHQINCLHAFPIPFYDAEASTRRTSVLIDPRCAHSSQQNYSPALNCDPYSRALTLLARGQGSPINVLAQCERNPTAHRAHSVTVTLSLSLLKLKTNRLNYTRL